MAVEYRYQECREWNHLWHRVPDTMDWHPNRVFYFRRVSQCSECLTIRIHLLDAYGYPQGLYYKHPHDWKWPGDHAPSKAELRKMTIDASMKEARDARRTRARKTAKKS